MTTYPVGQILDISYNVAGTKLYKVKWAGYDETKSSWEPHQNLQTMEPDQMKKLLRNLSDRKRYALKHGGMIRSKRSAGEAGGHSSIKTKVFHRRKSWHLIYKSRSTKLSE